MEKAKQAVGIAAAKLIEPNTIVGLGSGSTASRFIEALGERIKNGLTLKAVVATSRESTHLAQRFQMPLLDINLVDSIDVTVDGADEIDPQKQMIKGGGGAHVRERIVASCSKKLIIIVDESKLVPAVGKGKLPVEILPFGSRHAKEKLEQLGYRGTWRLKNDPHPIPFLTDNGNFILDLSFLRPPENAKQVEQEIKKIPGVVDTGFFLNMAHQVLIGHKDGSISPH